MFHLYGLTRAEVEHVLDSFFVVRKYEERDHGEFRTKRLDPGDLRRDGRRGGETARRTAHARPARQARVRGTRRRRTAIRPGVTAF